MWFLLVLLETSLPGGTFNQNHGLYESFQPQLDLNHWEWQSQALFCRGPLASLPSLTLKLDTAPLLSDGLILVLTEKAKVIM